MLSTLSKNKQTALVAYMAMKAKAMENPNGAMKKQFEESSKDSLTKVFNVISALSALGGNTVPFSAEDFTSVGTMASGLQNAHFFLIAMDASNKPEDIENLKKALNTHCWDKIADKIKEEMPDKSRAFFGSDLHQAYAPNETGSCQDGGILGAALGTLFAGGSAVAGFFTSTLPDFFTNDFANFFTDDVAGFITGDMLGFFKDLGGAFLDGAGYMGGLFTGIGSSVIGAGEDFGSWVGSSLGL